MRALDHTDLPRFNQVDWKRSMEKLSSMVSERAHRDWEFETHFDEDGSVGFSSRAGGDVPSDTEEQSRMIAQDEQIIRDVFDSFEWVVYR
jgi:hypothetical protein